MCARAATGQSFFACSGRPHTRSINRCTGSDPRVQLLDGDRDSLSNPNAFEVAGSDRCVDTVAPDGGVALPRQLNG